MTGALLKGLTTVECKSCEVSKAYEVILRRLPTRLTVPFYRIYLNLILGIVVYKGDKYVAYYLNDIIRINDIDTIT